MHQRRHASLIMGLFAVLLGACESTVTAPPLCGNLAYCPFGTVCQNGQCVALDAGGVMDAGVRPDAGAPLDAGVGMDAGVADAGVPDAGVMDAGVMDAGVMDAGVMDAGVMDAGPPTFTATRSTTRRNGVSLAWTMPGMGTPVSYELVRRSCDAGVACGIADGIDFAAASPVPGAPAVAPAGTPMTHTADVPLQAASTFAVRSTATGGGQSDILASNTIDTTLGSETLAGISTETDYGFTLRAASVDGDALSDLLVGRPRADNVGGGFRVLYGNGRAPTDVLAAQVGLTSATGRMGRALASAGDVDGDGFEDVIVGASGIADSACTAGGAGTETGRAYLFFGGPNGLRVGTVACGATGATADCWVEIPVPAGSGACSFGQSVAGVGNLGSASASARAYFAVGAGDLTSTSTKLGKVFVYKITGDRPTVTVTLVATLVGGADDYHFGGAVCGVRDVNGDGVPDMLVGATRRGQSPVLAGRAYVFLGGATYAGTGSTITVTAGGAGTSDGVVPITRDLGGDNFGVSCSGAGDLDGDGTNDFVIAAASGPQLGFFAVRGRADLDAAPPTGPPHLVGVTGAFTQTGEVSAGFDFDGDGRPDVALGDTNKVHIFPGRASGLVGLTPIATFTSTATVSTGLPVAIVPNWKNLLTGETALPDLAYRGAGSVVVAY